MPWKRGRPLTDGMKRSVAVLTATSVARKKPIEERFWAKVEKTDGCWLWTGAGNHLGYGQIFHAPTRKLLRATAVSLSIAGIDVPAGADICHHCDNPRCVRPDHLFIGDAKSNMRDCAAKGRLNMAWRKRRHVTTAEAEQEA